MYSIFRFFISLLLIVAFVPTVFGQEKAVVKNDSVPLLTGIRVEADISPALTLLSGSNEIFSYEAAVQFYIKNRYYPVVEVGYAGADKITTSVIGFKGEGLFYRLGMDFNMLKSKEGSKPTNNMLLLGARLGFTTFQYDLTNINLSDGYWNETVEKDIYDIPGTKMWFEISGGLRVELTKNIFAGWTFRYKNLITTDAIGDYKAWYVPGYGLNTEGVWGFNYLVGYKF